MAKNSSEEVRRILGGVTLPRSAVSQEGTRSYGALQPMQQPPQPGYPGMGYPGFPGYDNPGADLPGPRAAWNPLPEMPRPAMKLPPLALQDSPEQRAGAAGMGGYMEAPPLYAQPGLRSSHLEPLNVALNQQGRQQVGFQGSMGSVRGWVVKVRQVAG